MPDDERKRDRGAFFGSMHGTLNHLLWGDRIWLGRFIDEPCTAPAFGADLFADFAELARERETTDRKMLDWAGNSRASWLAGRFATRSKVDGRTRELPRAIAATHLFNHGTHHRGQLTTLLKQAGAIPGRPTCRGCRASCGSSTRRRNSRRRRADQLFLRRARGCARS